MDFNAYITQFQAALKDEIKKIRGNGGQKTYVNDGRYLGKRDDRHIYSFTADTELHLLDETQISLEYREKTSRGTLVSIVGFDLILALEEFMGEFLPTATLYTEPWFLLKELQDRLTSLETKQNANRRIAEQLLQQTWASQPPDIEQGRALLNHIEQQLGKPLTYNNHQLQAIGHVLSNRISFIWGPPGTGKTRTLGLTAAALAGMGKSVLLLAHSNAAVDVALLSAAQFLQKSSIYLNGQVLRVGITASPEVINLDEVHARGIIRKRNPSLITKMDKLEKERQQLVQKTRKEGLSNVERKQLEMRLDEIRHDLNECRRELRQAEKELIRLAQIIACTFSKATITEEIYNRQFDAVLLDEASMAYIPHCVLGASMAAKHLAIYGDFRQLAPISQANTELTKRWLSRDIFEQTGITQKVNNQEYDGRLVLLATQYRMHPTISAVPNTLFYQNRLLNAPTVLEQTSPIAQTIPQSGNALVFYDTTTMSAHCCREAESNSRFNLISALLSVMLAQLLVEQKQQVGIVTPYNAQSRLIHRLLRDLKLTTKQVQVATVHRFQGGERNVIIFDTVEGEPAKPGRLLAGEGDNTASRLTNVAVSRAKGKFITLANKKYVQEKFSHANSFHQLLDEINQRTTAVSLTWPRSGMNPLWDITLPQLTYYPESRKLVPEIEQSIQQAHEEIAIAWPGIVNNFHFSPQALQQCNLGQVRVHISGEGYTYFADPRFRIWSKTNHTPFGFVGVDRKQLWIYVNPQSPFAPVWHVELPQTVKLLYDFCRLMPHNETKIDIIENTIAEDKSPFGKCPQCSQKLWYEIGSYGPYMMCTAKCGYKRPLIKQDATAIAHLYSVVCDRCGGQVEGRKGDKGVFLGCTKYPTCRWTKDIRQILL